MIVEGGDSMISSPAATRGNAGIVSRNNEMVGLRRVLVEVSLVEKGRERKRGKASLGTVKSRLEISVHQEKDREGATGGFGPLKRCHIGPHQPTNKSHQ
ncbi:hypothetical protein MHYP_G00058770 [Metynnis hypsauchen]